MGWTTNEFREYERVTGHRHPFDRPRTSIQEQKDNRWKAFNNTPKMQKMDGGSDQQYHLSVEILVSDRRRRDLDGALATICDCIVTSRRRLEIYTEDNSDGEGSEKRRRGSKHKAD
jgi:hypothetical protein